MKCFLMLSSGLVIVEWVCYSLMFVSYSVSWVSVVAIESLAESASAGHQVSEWSGGELGKG